MKLMFSEQRADYERYEFPYVVWAVPDPDETPADLLAAGFMPTAPDLSRYHLCRHIRVPLTGWRPSSENRRILRKGQQVSVELVPRSEFAFTHERREFCKRYADAVFGEGVMSEARLDAHFGGRSVTHVLLFIDQPTGSEVGAATAYVEEGRAAGYWYAFYDTSYRPRNLGMFMMTSAVALFAERGLAHLYLGTCYSRSALYKTQFAGVEFFNGFRWSSDLTELRYLVQRTEAGSPRELLETADYLERFYEGGLAAVVEAAPLRATAR